MRAFPMPKWVDDGAGPIAAFDGAYSYLSNFAGPDEGVLNGVRYQDDEILYRTSEHAYQAAKFASPAVRKWIAAQETPSAAKYQARAYAGKAYKDWPSRSLEAMATILRSKFDLNPELAQRLVSTGSRELVEGNLWGDVFWGVCRCKGENHLGRLLMQVRHELQRFSTRWSGEGTQNLCIGCGEKIHPGWSCATAANMFGRGHT